MSTIEITQSAEIDAPAEDVFNLIADYRNGHPRILPQRWFTGLEIEAGGTGEGTIIRFGMKSGGRVQMARAEVSVPEPGRALVERVLDPPNPITTFTIDRLDEGRRCRLTIHTTWRPRGFQGLIQRMVAPGLLRKVYRDQLALVQQTMAMRV